jgi:hypothetical protein
VANHDGLITTQPSGALRSKTSRVVASTTVATLVPGNGSRVAITVADEGVLDATSLDVAKVFVRGASTNIVIGTINAANPSITLRLADIGDLLQGEILCSHNNGPRGLSVTEVWAVPEGFR